jgi:hypothetical protein
MHLIMRRIVRIGTRKASQCTSVFEVLKSENLEKKIPTACISTIAQMSCAGLKSLLLYY